jgi:hypothetical protein
MSHDRESIKAGRNRRNTSRWVVSVVKAASTIVWLLLPTAASQRACHGDIHRDEFILAERAAIAAVDSTTLPQIQAGRPPRRHAIQRRSPAMAVRTPLAVAPRPATFALRWFTTVEACGPDQRTAKMEERGQDVTSGRADQTLQVLTLLGANMAASTSAREVIRSTNAMRRRCRRAAAIGDDNGPAFPQVNPGVVGLAGLEPAPSSLSAIQG